MKLWQGRFNQNSAKNADIFNESLSVDKQLYMHDIIASVAHAKMLGTCDIISMEDSNLICDTLMEILKDIQDNKLKIKDAEDIHSFVENELINRIGSVGKMLHTARSRNDQVATDLRLYTKDSILNVCTNIRNLIARLLEISESTITNIMPGYTHLRKAQPITVAQYFNAYSEMFLRDLERFADTLKRTDVMPLGSGALAGTSFPIDRRMTAELLSFGEISQNALDAVSDRDFVAEYIFAAALTMSHLSRFCEDLMLFSTEEFGFIDIADSYTTGSSIMPQKKNLDIFELIRGKCGRVYGDLTTILTVIKGLPLAYNKDLQEDKEALFDAEDTVLSCLTIFNEVLSHLLLDTKKMRTAANGGNATATDVANYLVEKGMPFRDAYEITGRIVQYCIEEDKSLLSMSFDEFVSFSDLFEEDILSAVKVNTSVNERRSIGGSSRAAVRDNIRSITRRLNKLFKG